MNKNRNKRYSNRILAFNEEITNDTRVTGLNNNDMLIGGPGSGKTGGYVIPNIQNIDGSLVVSDTKGQLERKFKNELLDKGYKVYTLDLVDPKRSCGYNPLDYIRRYEDGALREQDVMTLSRIICPTMDSHEPIWDMCTASYLSFLMGYVLETEEHPDMMMVAEAHRDFAEKNGDIPFRLWMEDNPDSFATKKFRDLAPNRAADKMWSSIEGFMNIALEPFSFREASYIFSNKDCFDLNILGKEKTVLFLNVSDTDRSADQMVNIVYSQVLHVLCNQADSNPDGRLKVPVRIIMDDFAASARIPDFDKIISIIRSRDISVSLILQSISQLETMYTPPAAKTIVNNCDNILFLGSQDRDTAEYIGYRAFRTPEVILSMPRDMAYLLRSGEKARLVRKIPPYSTVEKMAETKPDEAGKNM